MRQSVKIETTVIKEGSSNEETAVQQGIKSKGGSGGDQGATHSE